MTTLDSNAVGRVVAEFDKWWIDEQGEERLAGFAYECARTAWLAARSSALPPVGLIGEEAPDCESNADYIEFCGQKLVGLGYRIAGTTLSAIAAEHRRLTSQSSQAPGAVGEAVAWRVDYGFKWCRYRIFGTHEDWVEFTEDLLPSEYRVVPLYAHPPTSPEVTEEMTRLGEVMAFLDGSAELDGLWFGEESSEGAPYWWRTPLRKSFAALSAALNAGAKHER